MATSIYTGEEPVKVLDPNCKCNYCAEPAYEIVDPGIPMCGIPGNHPEMEISEQSIA